MDQAGVSAEMTAATDDRPDEGQGQGSAGSDSNASDPGAASNSGSEAELQAKLSAAEAGMNAQRDLHLRAVAELDNVRKRAQRDIESAHRFAVEGFAGELLAVRDSLELGVKNGATADSAALLAGQEATLKLLERAFEKFSVKRIEPDGQPFDPNLHEAMLMQPAPGVAAGTVLQVVQPGYELRGRLLRPARVIVAKGEDG